jgi:hypothetical protein
MFDPRADQPVTGRLATTTGRTDPPRVGTTAGQTGAVLGIVTVVIGIIAVAFRGSWGALRDAALAAHFERSAADLYPWGVDGLMVVAIIALVLLRDDRRVRWYCLGIIGSYTVASWYINFLHGLGMFAVDPATGTRPVPPWYVVFVIASLVIGSIFLGSHLLVHVWLRLFPTTAPDEAPEPVNQAGTEADDDRTGVPEPPDAPVDNLAAARLAYRQSLAPGLQRLSQTALMKQFRISKREAAQVQSDVRAELDAEVDASRRSDSDDEPPSNAVNGRVPALNTGGAS